VGPKAFVFKDPDTGFNYKANTRPELVQLIVNYRYQNNLPPIEALDMVLEHYWCLLPQNAGSCTRHPMKTGWSAFLRKGMTLFKFVAFKKFVEQCEADNRSETCIGCPANSFPDRKGFIKWAQNASEAVVGGRKSVHHDELGECSICKCNLRSKVWIGTEIELSKDEVARMQLANPGCWQVKSKLLKVIDG